jgi:hypothetical protein
MAACMCRLQYDMQLIPPRPVSLSVTDTCRGSAAELPA